MSILSPIFLKFLWVIVGLSLVLAMTANGSEHETIPPGTYRSEGGAEKIVAGSSVLCFQIQLEEKSRLHERKYKYSVWSDGRIMPYPQTSYEMLYGIGRYDWFWRDGKIARTDQDTGKTTWFERVDDGNCGL